jgi:hypothetical protein
MSFVEELGEAGRASSGSSFCAICQKFDAIAL